MNVEDYLSKFDKFTKNPTLDAMKYIMSKYGNPHTKLKCIHVAGTNGKGSVCEMISNCLINAGYKVGKFISPHLIKFNDGIWVNNNQITDDEVEEILLPLSKVVEAYNNTHKIPVKWFEVITSLVLIYFYKKQCDLVILETGLGGALDCTNIVNPIVSVITKIGYDHVDILGNTIEEIAKQKAGIIKPNSETVFINQPNVTKIIEEKCKEMNNKLHIINSDDMENYSYNDELQKFDYKNYKNIEINLKGKVQIQNAAECIEAMNILENNGIKISKKAVYQGLKTVVHHARMEKISDNPLIVFDGGHNESAIQNLKENIEQYYSGEKRVYIISILKTKDYRTIIKELAEDNEAIFYFTNGIEEKPYVPAELLAQEAIKYVRKEQIVIESIESAVKEVRRKYSDRVVFIVGSFYIYKNVMENI